MTEPTRTSRWMRWVGVTAVALAIGAAVGWAASTALTPASDPTTATAYTTVEVERGEVEASTTLNTVARWQAEVVGTNQASGVVTTVVAAAGDEVGQASVLYRVDERPVVVAAGDVPAYRDIAEGAEGADVAQVQRMLAAAGFPVVDDGKAGPATTAAITAWQKANGVAQTGTVGIGDVIFVPTLPSRVTLDAELVARGARLSGGEAVVRALPPAPRFHIPLTEAQARLVPAGTRVEVTSPEGEIWIATAGDQVPVEESGTIEVTLVGAEDASICGDACAQVPVAGEVLLASRIITVQPVTGSVVPSAALITDATGAAFVVDEDGERIAVRVIASAKGMSVVEGVSEGTTVRIPAETDTAP